MEPRSSNAILATSILISRAYITRGETPNVNGTDSIAGASTSRIRRSIATIAGAAGEAETRGNTPAAALSMAAFGGGRSARMSICIESSASAMGVYVSGRGTALFSAKAISVFRSSITTRIINALNI